jgi:hypothetical protein
VGAAVEIDMKHSNGARMVFLGLAVAIAGVLAMPHASHADTRGENRRDSRDTRQEGRDDARDAKQDCRGEGGSGVECRGEKHEAKQDTREDARDEKYDPQ